jgi:hypothetical protein
VKDASRTEHERMFALSPAERSTFT